MSPVIITKLLYREEGSHWEFYKYWIQLLYPLKDAAWLLCSLWPHLRSPLTWWLNSAGQPESQTAAISRGSWASLSPGKCLHHGGWHSALPQRPSLWESPCPSTGEVYREGLNRLSLFLSFFFLGGWCLHVCCFVFCQGQPFLFKMVFGLGAWDKLLSNWLLNVNNLV